MPVAAPAPDAPPRNQAGGGRLLRWVGPIAALAVAGYGVALALMAGAGAGATAAFCAYWLLAVLVPERWSTRGCAALRAPGRPT